MDTGRRDILVVDDDDAILEMLVELLRDAGYAVRGAANGAEALIAVYERQPALILLDLVMPEMDGASVSRELRKHHPTLPIMLITASPDDGRTLIVDGLADCVVDKPFELDTLLTCIARLMPATHARIAHVQWEWRPYPELMDRCDELTRLSQVINERFATVSVKIATLNARFDAITRGCNGPLR
jgi:CheY-like chemotaxis protein